MTAKIAAHVIGRSNSYPAPCNWEAFALDALILTGYLLAFFTRTGRAPAVTAISLALLQLAGALSVYALARGFKDLASLFQSPGLGLAIVFHIQVPVLIALLVCAVRVACGYDGSPRMVPSAGAISGNRAAGIALAASCGMLCLILAAFYGSLLFPEIQRHLESRGRNSEMLIILAVILGIFVAGFLHMLSAAHLVRRRAWAPILVIVLAAMKFTAAALMFYFIVREAAVVRGRSGDFKNWIFLLEDPGWADETWSYLRELLLAEIGMLFLFLATIFTMARILREKREQLFPVALQPAMPIMPAPVVAEAAGAPADPPSPPSASA